MKAELLPGKNIMHTFTPGFYSGTSGLVLPVPKSAYPEAFRDQSRLTYYASLFNSLEINSSFYKMPKVSTIQKWVASVPQYFQFTFKLSKTITHNRDLAFDAADVRNFMEVIDEAGQKQGCILVQFPPALTIEKINQLKKLLGKIQQINERHRWKLAIEFRNRSWYNQHTRDLLNMFNAAMVIHDLPTFIPVAGIKSDFVYLRFHGPGGRYRGSYDDAFLHQHSQQIRTWIKKGKTVYVYFNNTMGDAVKNVATLNDYVRANTAVTA